MKRSGAIWLVVGVIAVAAVLMYFVVMPQIKDGKTVEDIAKKAEETVNDVKKAVNDAGKEVEKAADGVEEAKVTALAKMARIGQDTKGAADEMKALFDNGTPTAEQIAAAKAKLATALKSASELDVPAEADSAAKAAAAKITEGAKAALAALDTLPADPAAAKAALADLEAKMMAALPDGLAVKPADATLPAKTDDGATKTDAKTEQKADGATETEKPADAAKAATPAFDILRVEKDGSTVIAGRAEPGAKIEIVDGDKVIASADADQSGDFAAVLDNPLASGDHSITLKATTKDGKSSTSEEVATVSVPKDSSGELLAMVTKPGEASKIITMPEVKDAEVASNKSVTPDASEETTTADGAATNQDAAKAQETAKVEIQDAAKADVTKTDEAAKTTADAAADTNAKVAVATPDLPANSSDIASTPPLVAEDDAAGKTNEQQTAKADQATVDTSAAKPADTAQPTEQKQPVGAAEVMVSAVELEGDKIFIAGSTRPGATVRLYADDQVVAEATADADGRFVADGKIKLAVGNHTIRADVLSGDGSKVELRASVPFFRPEGDLAAVASNDAAKDKPAIEPLANGTFDKARNEAGKALGLLQGLYANGQMPSAEELAAARSSAEIALKSLAEVRVPGDVDPALAAMATKASQEAGKALDRLKAVPADVAAFKSALGDVETIVGSAVKPATEVATANDAGKTVTEPAKQDAATADQTKPADETKPADTIATTAQTVEKTGDQISSDEVQVTAKVDRLTKSTEATANDQAKVDPNASAEMAAKPADGASAAATTEAKVDSNDATTTGNTAASQDTASTDQPKVIEQAPLKQSDESVIIRRGDTLWQISRRVYGRGVRYTTIYVANKTQINDPDRIMPGQIFSMPGKWLDNAEELHKERLQHPKP